MQLCADCHREQGDVHDRCPSGGSARVKVAARALGRILAIVVSAAVVGVVGVACTSSQGSTTGAWSASPVPPHYVSPTGSAMWEDSMNPATPCSLATATASVGAGDRVYLRGGTYGSSAVTLSPSGESGSEITWQGYPGETAVLPAGLVVSGDYNTVLSGIAVRHGPASTTSAGIIEFLGNHNVVRGASVHSASTDSGTINVVDFAGSHNSAKVVYTGQGCGAPSFAGSSTYDTFDGGGGTFPAAGTSWIYGDHNSVLNAHFVGTTKHNVDAVWILGDDTHVGTNTRIAGCTFRQIADSGSGQHVDLLQWWHASPNGLLVEDCVIGSKRLYDLRGNVQPGDPAGAVVQFDQEVPQVGPFTFRDNVVCTSGEVVFGANVPTANPLNGWIVCNNDFHVEGSIWFNTAGDWNNTRFVDNIIAHGYAPNFTPNIGTGTVVDHNMYVGVSEPANEGAHSFRSTQTLTQTFVNPDLSSATDYGVRADWRLKAGSVALGAGVQDTSTPVADKNGSAGAGATDIGASRP